VKGGGSGLVARPIFKIVMEASLAAPVGSIPTRSRHLIRLVREARVAVRLALTPLMLPVLLAPRLAAQDSTAVRPDSLAADTLAVPDTTVRKGPSPTGALLKSLIIPGLGQITLGRKLTAVVFLAFEGATLGMVIKTQRDINRAEAAGDLATVADKKRAREDWLVYMGINHVASALEAYVSAHLWDFPGELQIRAVPGGVGAAASIPMRIR
jgi:hypothetical protein